MADDSDDVTVPSRLGPHDAKAIVDIMVRNSFDETAKNFVRLILGRVFHSLNSRDAGLPAAIAVAILHPRRRVLAVCGDGGFMMNSQEMETAVRLRLNVVVLVLQDDAYGMIRWKQQVDSLPDFGRLCESALR